MCRFVPYSYVNEWTSCQVQDIIFGGEKWPKNRLFHTHVFNSRGHTVGGKILKKIQNKPEHYFYLLIFFKFLKPIFWPKYGSVKMGPFKEESDGETAGVLILLVPTVSFTVFSEQTQLCGFE